MSRPAPTPPTKRICGQCHACQNIFDFKCCWLDGFGNDRDQPNQGSCIVTIVDINNQFWVHAIETTDNGIRSGKDLIMDVANKLDLPIMVFYHDTKYPSVKPDLYILTTAQKLIYNIFVDKSLGYLDNDKRLEILLPRKIKKTNTRL